MFVWHDPEGNPPADDVTIPLIEGADSAEWTGWTWDSILVEDANCREVIDNVVDMPHFFYIHFAFPTFFKNVFEGHIATQYLRTRARPDVGPVSRPVPECRPGGGEVTLRSEASYYGPSYMIDYLWQDYHGMAVESVLINCHYPVTPTSFMLQWGVIVKRPPGMSDEPAAKFGAGSRSSSASASSRTWRSGCTRAGWTTRCCARRTGRCTSCGAGTSSSTPDAAEVEPDMIARYEFEVDTTRAGGGLGGGGRAEPGRQADRRQGHTARHPGRVPGHGGLRCRSGPRSGPTTATPPRSRSSAPAAARPPRW